MKLIVSSEYNKKYIWVHNKSYNYNDNYTVHDEVFINSKKYTIEE